MGMHLEDVTKLIKSLDAQLDAFTSSLGLPATINDEIKNAATAVLNMEDLSKLTYEECAEKAAKLAQYAFFLQKSINKELARINLLDREIAKAISSKIEQQIGSTDKRREVRAIMENAWAKEMYDAKEILQRRIDATSFLSQKVNDMRQSLLELGQSRKGTRSYG